MGVERSVLMTNMTERCRSGCCRSSTQRPDRFNLGLGGHNLLRPMENLRRLESFVADHQVAYTVVGPSFWGDGMYPPSDAVYYPLYTKCCELELPLCMNTGLPGPPIPGEVQNPIHLDRVCVRFPELKLCMMHGADPWWDVAIRLMIKYANLRLMTSAWSPRHLPESLLHFMSHHGARTRVMFASDSPVLSITQVRQGGRRTRPRARGARRLPVPERAGLLLQPGTDDGPDDGYHRTGHEGAARS